MLLFLHIRLLSLVLVASIMLCAIWNLNLVVPLEACLLFVLGRVVQKPVNANPGLKVNQSINFSCIKMFFTAYVLRSWRLLKFKTEGKAI